MNTELHTLLAWLADPDEHPYIGDGACSACGEDIEEHGKLLNVEDRVDRLRRGAL